MARSVYIVALLLPACAGASLQDFSGSELALDLSGDGHIEVSLGAAQSCRTLSGDLRVTINGQPLTIVTRGGESLTTAGWSCATPRFSGEALPAFEADALLEIDDGETRLVLQARNLFAERRLNAKGKLADGRWAFVWVPATDEDRSATWRIDALTGALFGQAQLHGNELTLDLSGASLTSGTLRVEGQASAPIERCEGVARCRTTVSAASDVIMLSGGVE